MPSIISHPAVAVALAPIFQRFRVPQKIFFLGACCTIVPDFDVVGFFFGIEYESLFGHRGFSHSLLFAALLSTIIVFGFLRERTDLSPITFYFSAQLRTEFSMR
jgi:inner membrane protein